MSAPSTMQVHLQVPAGTLFDGEAGAVFAVAENGAFGILPRHADHVAPLVPSVVVITESTGTERYFGIDHGLLVKHDRQVDIVVRRALEGENLLALSTEIESGFLEVDEQERTARTALSRLEIGIMRHLGDLRKPNR